MLVFIKLTVIFQLTKIQNFLSEYALELASTDFDKIDAVLQQTHLKVDGNEK